MIRPIEYEERARLGGFSILDNDFDLMAGDLCSEDCAGLGVKRICESAKTVFRYLSDLWRPESEELKAT